MNPKKASVSNFLTSLQPSLLLRSHRTGIQGECYDLCMRNELCQHLSVFCDR